MKRNKALWDAKTPALTPASVCGTTFHPAPDIRVEKLLYKLLKAEQRKNTRLIEVLRQERANFADYIRHRRIKAVASRLIPSHKEVK